MTKHFNDISRLVASEVLRVPEIHKRVAIIEKWAAVADICRCFHNFNGVLQICAAFTNSSVYRLKRTWEKVAKTVRIILKLSFQFDFMFFNKFFSMNRLNKLSKSYRH